MACGGLFSVSGEEPNWEGWFLAEESIWGCPSKLIDGPHDFKSGPIEAIKIIGSMAGQIARQRQVPSIKYSVVRVQRFDFEPETREVPPLPGLG